MKKTLIFIFLIFSSLLYSQVFFKFSSSLYYSSDETYNQVYPKESFGYSLNLGYALFEGIYPSVEFGGRSVNGNTTFTGEPIELSFKFYGASLIVFPLDALFEDYIFIVSPFLNFEILSVSFVEKYNEAEYSERKSVFYYGGGVSVTIDENKKLIAGVSYKPFKLYSELWEKEIDMGGIEFYTGIIIRFL